MTHVYSTHGVLGGVGRFFEHAAAVVVGLTMMVAGLAMGVTMVLLPVGVVIGLLGVAMLIGGLFARIDGSTR
jgi:hypothetical protein